MSNVVGSNLPCVDVSIHNMNRNNNLTGKYDNFANNELPSTFYRDGNPLSLRLYVKIFNNYKSCEWTELIQHTYTF
jgi:hypothetical protein